MAPLRVARITSPDPIYSDTHTMDGPRTAKMASPVSGVLMVLRDGIKMIKDRKIIKNLPDIAWQVHYIIGQVRSVSLLFLFISLDLLHE